MIYTVILLSQILFNVFDVLKIRFTYENRVTPLLITTVFINIVTLSSVFYSVGGLLEGDYLIIPFYIGGSVIGKYLGMKYRDHNIKDWKNFQVIQPKKSKRYE